MRFALVLFLAACGPDPCDAFVDDATTCYDDFCSADGSDTAFCGCWNQGMDIDVSTCECVPLNLEAACDVYDLSEYEEGDLDCPAAEDALAGFCAT